jgi:glycosyltransferase involved in cell wall biosynthesis
MNDITKCSISVIISTKDEERNIADCIKSVNWCGAIIMYNSISTDRTTIIAERFGAKIIKKTYDSFSSHKNWALCHIPFRYKWVFFIDADERVSPQLKKEISLAIKNDRISGYYIPRMNIFMGKWIRHGDWFPDY